MERRDFLKNAVATGATGVTASWLAGLLPLATETTAAGAGKAPLRPPGALSESEFLARCIRCQRCIDACPNQAILPLDDSFGPRSALTPGIQARRQSCMLCNKVEGETLKCTEACPSGALQLIQKDPQVIQEKVAMGVAEIDLALCYSYNSWSCGACFRACPFPERAMTLGLWERPEVNPDACVGCGCCERACIRYPQAIRVRTGEGRAPQEQTA